MNHILKDGEIVQNEIRVNIDTLDTIFNEVPFLIKIDVEGYELPVLRGATRILESPELCAVIMELNGSGNAYGFDESEILHLMFGYGFHPYSYDPLTRKLTRLEGKNASNGNTLFIRNEAFVSERIRTAPMRLVQGVSL